jgi:hypothetical protein
MARESKFTKLERQYGKPIEEILVEKLNRLGTIEKLAADIDVTVAHTSRTLKRLGVKKQPTWSAPEVEHADPV